MSDDRIYLVHSISTILNHSMAANYNHILKVIYILVKNVFEQNIYILIGGFDNDVFTQFLHNRNNENIMCGIHI